MAGVDIIILRFHEKSTHDSNTQWPSHPGFWFSFSFFLHSSTFMTIPGR
jgi:hypothetical protein